MLCHTLEIISNKSLALACLALVKINYLAYTTCLLLLKMLILLQILIKGREYCLGSTTRTSKERNKLGETAALVPVKVSTEHS